MKVKYINQGVGFRIGDIIYLNSALKSHPKLHKAILSHEKKHTRGFSLKDFLIDISNEDLREVKREYYKFIFTHPRALIMYSPIIKIDNHWSIDITLSIFYLLVGGLIWFLM